MCICGVRVYLCVCLCACGCEGVCTFALVGLNKTAKGGVRNLFSGGPEVPLFGSPVAG